MTDPRSYADRADSATTFDPELQSDVDAEREIKRKRSEISDALDKELQDELDHAPKSIMEK